MMMHMENLTFVCPPAGSGPEALIMAESIRRFAGSLANSPIWMVVPEREEIPAKMRSELLACGVQIKTFSEPDISLFPFARFVCAAAAAESLAKRKTELLAWIDVNTIVMNEPRHFLLDEGKTLGYRPVHHTLIGSVYAKPLDPFWALIYQKCNVTEEKIFPMKTHVDHHVLRPYFNAGCLVVRPGRGLLRSWWDRFKALHRDRDFEEYYEKDQLYTIFMHQAVLAGVILSTMERVELQELPFSYNYPLHLYEESPRAYRPQAINDLVTARYYLDKLREPQALERIPLHNPLKSWLAERLQSAEQRERENP